MENWLIVIPARLKSTRLPEKPLQLLGGKPLIVKVYENLRPLENEGAKIIIATDSQKVIDICKKFQIPVELTSEKHPCGTDRVQEVALRHSKQFILNVQGDEPFVSISDLKKLINALPLSKYKMGTLAYLSNNQEHWLDRNVVKGVWATDGRAL
ncbi:NTP transferase domain-containing protein, partial [Dolichospermum sp. ST_sed1]|nr:NTP transferase domain-containing protein [Dolichospermum sp. ST_sed1]